MKTFLVLSCAVALLPHAGASPRTTTSNDARPASNNRFVFSLLPKAFQKNPAVDFNILTEMTAEGRRRKEPTAENPSYCVAHLTPLETYGFIGDNLSKHAPSAADIENVVTQALRARHYLPAAAGAPRPTVALIVHWGTYGNPARKSDDMNPAEELERVGMDEDGVPYTSPAAPTAFDQSTALGYLPFIVADKAKTRALIERAKLIGGRKFAREIAEVLEKEVSLRRAANSAESSRAASEAATKSFGNPSVFSDTSSMMGLIQSSSPMAIFMRRDVRTEEMVEELFSDSYYVIISAVDYDSLLRKRPVLLWRTKMSLSSLGVSAAETMPQLVRAGAPYLGRETETAVLVTKRIPRGGTVDIGRAEVQEYMDPAKPAGHP